VIVEGRPCCFSSNFVGREREREIETDLVGRESFCFWILSGEFCLLDSVPFAFEKMKWFDKLFKRSGSSPDDDNGEAGVHVHGHHFSHNGPHLFSKQGPRGNNEGTFYTNDRPAAGSSDLQNTAGTRERPSPNVNDEQLARAMQERPTSENNQPPQHVPEAVPRHACI
jgi:hypothetical protein